MYIPGNPWFICDRCGGQYRKSQIRKEWTGLMVCMDCFDEKHPQLSVRGRVDKIAVQDARPDADVDFGSTTLSSSAAEYAQTVDLTTVTKVYRLTSLGIELDDGSVQWTFATADPSGSTVTLEDKLRGAAASGNTVHLSTDIDAPVTTLTAAERKAAL